MIAHARAARAVFPPEQVAEVKAIACELPAINGVPLSRFSRAELHRLVIERVLIDASATTIWRWLGEDAIKPWSVRSWLFVRDPDFRFKAARALERYQRRFAGRRLRPEEFVISADERSQLQALGPRHATLAVGPGRAQDRHRTVRSPNRPGHERRALRRGASGLLDRRQRLLARGQGLDHAP